MGISKTKLFTGLFVLVTVLQAAGVIHLSPEVFQSLQTIFGGGVAWGFRDAIGKAGAEAAPGSRGMAGGTGGAGGAGGAGGISFRP